MKSILFPTSIRNFQSITLLSVLSLLISCGPSQNTESDQWDESNVRSLATDDARVAEARKLAQDSIGFFLSTYRKYNNDERYMFSVKSKFSQDKMVEHMWSRPIGLNDTDVIAVVDNIPQTLTNLSFGDTVNINFSEIEDLIIVYEDSLVVGSFLTSMMPAPEN